MQFSESAYLKSILELQFEPLQLGYIVCQYDKIIYVKDFHQYILAHLFDVHQLFHLAPTKALVDEKQVNTVVLSCIKIK